ncbi:DNA-binding transcriptional regulator, LysR family [Dyella sp. OK004]|uniref:LysR family transcriptional regulator n=1 Tax=Dyella sp. OK004 TaxID=1855292 RepID=UPI0008EC0FCA|nr:LysR family transcriptional regulator [Dyella sp. OK004]SFR94835.1 DNA-binding transcriptional regulator, LysR family [Dyella sp. OK004]
MDPTELAELAAFAAVARHLSFRQAAAERGTSASAVSHAIRHLEARVGVRLFHRTTRSVSLTEAGAMLAGRMAPALADMRDAMDALNAYRDTPFGTVRLNVPNSIAPFLLDDVLVPLLQRNPGLRLDVVATDRLVDIVAEGFDAGIRFGERLSQDMVAVRVRASFRFTVVGAPDYFREHPMPRTPHELHEHTCIRYAFPSGALLPWEFVRNGESMQVDVDGPLTVDSQELMASSAARGLGLAYVWEERAAPYLHDGRLQRCLQDWCATDDNLFLYFPNRRHVSAGLRAVIEAIKA